MIGSMKTGLTIKVHGNNNNNLSNALNLKQY